MKAHLLKLLVGAIAAVILAACSKGSGSESGSSGTTTAPPSNWDSLVWDQGKWQ